MPREPDPRLLEKKMSADQKTHRESLEVLRALLSDSNLSETAMRIAGLSYIDHVLAGMDGRTVETEECLQWGVKKLQELGIEVVNPSIPESTKQPRMEFTTKKPDGTVVSSVFLD